MQLIIWGLVGISVIAAGIAAVVGGVRGGAVLGSLVIVAGLAWSGMTLWITLGFARMSHARSSQP
jgi:hypothetical protein